MNTNKFLKELIIMIIGGLIINVICFFIGSIYSRAATSQYALPYIISGKGYNTIFNVQSYNMCIDEIDYYGYSEDDDFIIYSQEYSYYDSERQSYIVEVMINPEIPSNWSFDSNFDWSTTHVPLNGTDIIEVRMQYLNGSFTSSSSRLQNITKYLLGSQLTRQDKLWGVTEGTWTPFYPCYYSGSGLYDSNNNLVIAQEVIQNVPVSGTVTGPNTGHYIPNHNNTGTPTLPPRPTINNYTWTTYNNPPIDTSTLENLVESLIDVVTYNFSYLFTNLSGLFSNIIDNIKNFIDYIQDTLLYVGRSIQDSIKDTIDLIYNNLVSLFEPTLNYITEKFGYLTEELDSEVIYDSFSSSYFGSDFTSIKTNINTFVTSFNSVSEPSSYTIPIHIENVSIFSNVSTQYIDLGWLNSVKTPLRAFVWCIVTYGLIMSIIDSIPNYINGGGGEDD